MGDGELIAFLVTLIVIAGVTLMIAAMMNRRRMQEMAHRERLAMIDRGLLPSPERDPAGFERVSGLGAPRASAAAVRFRTSGIILIGIGIGMMFLITFTAGAPEVGIGIGGAWAALGLALLLNYFLMIRREDERHDLNMSPRWTPPPPRPPEPPSGSTP